MNKGNEAATKKLIDIILRTPDHSITVQDEEEIVLRRSRDAGKIFSKLDTTSEDYLAIWSESQGKYIGTFVLIYDNADDGSEVISDYTYNPICQGIFNEWEAK